MKKLLTNTKRDYSNYTIHRIAITGIIMLVYSAALPCGNEFGHRLDGTKIHSSYFYLSPYYLKFDTVKLRKQIADYNSKYSITDAATYPLKSIEKDKYLSNKALALTKFWLICQCQTV